MYFSTRFVILIFVNILRYLVMSDSSHFASPANPNMLVNEDFILDFSTVETRNHNTALTCTIKSRSV